MSIDSILRQLSSGEISAEQAARLLMDAPRGRLPSQAMSSSELRERVEVKLRQLVATVAKIPASRVELHESVERYGFDSVMVLDVVRALETDFGKLSPTLLFEHQTIGGLASYLVEHQPDGAMRAIGADRSRGHAAKAELLSIERAAERELPRQPEPLPTSTLAGEIAIIGLSCRFPLADDLDEFWRNLEEGRDCITEIPADRWDYRINFDPEKGKPGRTYSKWGGFIRDVDKFDAGFFHISPREAERMDPQERLFLEEVWHALEDAAVTRERLATKTVGVYVGVMYAQYQLFEAEEALKGNHLYLGSSYASIANRVSYFFNFRGPSIALDTMCSSSLTAIHLACEALRSGEIDAAVVGGVNLTIHPSKHVDLSQGRFASSDGRCRSFGAQGDGYVPGEGVGVAILKPLSSAVADGDRIYAVIRGTALNHGGKTNGYTAPNPRAQGRLITEALSRARVDPRRLSYVETHGTGTALGDPIEIAGLVAAFREQNQDVGYCAIGSVKSNIGHLESAAGIAALAKVVLQMRRRKLVPSLHAETLNPHVDFDTTPFYVQRTLAEWRQPVVPHHGSLQTCTRIAGISSFGAGGSNAHVVVEEYIEAPGGPAGERPHVFLLSARDEERLRVHARALADHLARPELDAVHEGQLLASVAFTLQVGREALEERLGLRASTRLELIEKLREFADRGEAPGLLRNRVADSREELDLVLAGSAGQAFLSILMESQDLERLARLWVRGLAIDWERLTPKPAPRRIALPGYPFARERHWPTLTHRAVASVAQGGADPLHPLVGRNVSTLREQRFTITFDGTEPFLRDHRVAGRMLVPGAAIIEMARAAAALSGLGELPVIERIAWESPIGVESGRSREISISLSPGSGDVNFTVWSEPSPGHREVHARGKLIERSEPTVPGTELLDPVALSDACTESIEPEWCYRAFKAIGLEYGPAFRPIELVRRGDSHALVRLRLPSIADSDRTAYVLPPTMLDGAFQALVALHHARPDDVLHVPFAVDRVEILDRLPDVCLVHVVARRVGANARGDAATFDLTIADEQGLVIARIRGLSTRPLPSVREPLRRDAPAPLGTVVVEPIWREAGLPRAGEPLRNVLILEDGDRASEVLARAIRRHSREVSIIRVRRGAELVERADGGYEVDPADAEQFGRLLERIAIREARSLDIIHAWSQMEAVEGPAATPGTLATSFYSVMAATQALMRSKPAKRARLLYVHPAGAHGAHPLFAAMGAVARTIARESPSLALDTLEVAAGADEAYVWDDDVADRVVSELTAITRGGEEIRYHGHRRLVRGLELVANAEPRAAAIPLKQDGIYLLTGGMGGIGRIFAWFLTRRWNARLVLSGRSALDAERAEFLDRLAAQGGRAIYVQADCTRFDDAQRLVREAKRAFGRLDGVLHLAGTIRDALLIRKRGQDAEVVLAPKVLGTYHLDESTRDDPLDFFALFSSVTAVIGTVGQSDYAFANAFMDSFAAQRERARSTGMRSGRTVSIGWPLWEGGGMGVDEAAKIWIERTLGWIPLPEDVGARAFEAALAAGCAHRALFYGHRAKILDSLGLAPESTTREHATSAASRPLPVPAGDALRSRDVPQDHALLTHLRSIVAAELKMPVQKLDPRESIERFGIESVMIMNVTRQLEVDFGELPKTLFFEHRTLVDLARYFLEEHADRVATRFRAATPDTSAAPSPYRTEAPPFGAPRFVAAGPRGRTEDSEIHEPIAIIGLSGRYPMADTLDELWTVLSEGRDCVTEVPPERWNHQTFFDPTKGRHGKSYTKWGGFLRDVDRFDPLFFNISPREARLMDPQERLFLQTAWHALEDAGHTRRESELRRAGVFVGVMYNHYQLYGAHESMQKIGFIPSSLSASIANRVSYVLDLRGPSMAIDTMCSSSLTALHLACASILRGECDLAIAGGVNATVHPNKYLQLSQGKFASSDGKCRSFGDGGDGYVPGEGVGAVLLKPLRRALADGDHIYAVIRGSAMNHGGRTNGYTVPSPDAQAEVIRSALKRAGVDASDISCVEAHGTGTSLGDPIEIAGLARAFRSMGPELPVQGCPIGSIKSNIGHLESAAGIAGVTKVLLQMRHGMLVPSIHAEHLNQNIEFDTSPFFVQRKFEPWPSRVRRGEPRARIAAVSSFGAGGSNVHLLLEEHVATPTQEVAPGPQVIILSARTAPQLCIYASALADSLAPRPAALDPGAGIDERRLINEITGVAAEIVNVAPADVSPDDDLESLGFDPVALTALALELNREYEVELASGELAECRTIRVISRYIAARRRSGVAIGVSATPSARLLRDIAFTLQVGREAFEERLAVIAGSVEELAHKLREASTGSSAIDGVLRGHATSGASPWSSLLEGDEGDAYVQALLAGASYTKLAALWTSGVDLDWSVLHRDRAARRVSLPTYPFARDRYWTPDGRQMEDEVTDGGASTPQVSVPGLAPRPSASSAVGQLQHATAEEMTSAALQDVREHVGHAVIGAISAVLEIDRSELDLDLPHSDFGVDSVLAVDIVDRINAALGAELKPTDFFNYSTIRKLSEHIAREYAPRLVAAPAPEAASTITGTPPARVRDSHRGGGARIDPAPPGPAQPSAADDGRLRELLLRLRRGEISVAAADRLIEELA